MFLLVPSVTAAAPRPIPVKVVVVAMFESGADTGDKPGELQYWVERDHLDRVYPLPAAYHAVRMNDQGEMAVLTGPGTAHAAATIMAVGLDPRFDFSHAYWLIAGIAGGCPDQVSLGSAMWARWVVDGDLGYEIDAREIPQDWTTGYLPFHKTRPFETPAEPVQGQVYALDAGLVEWAFDLTRGMPLEDSDKLKEIRSHFDGAAAQRPPSVGHGRRDLIVDLLAWQADGCMGLEMGAVFHRGQRSFCNNGDGGHGNAAIDRVPGAGGRVSIGIACWFCAQ